MERRKNQPTNITHVNDSLTTGHIEKELVKKQLTTAHLNQAFLNNQSGDKAQAGQSGSNDNPQGPQRGTGKDK